CSCERVEVVGEEGAVRVAVAVPCPARAVIVGAVDPGPVTGSHGRDAGAQVRVLGMATGAERVGEGVYEFDGGDAPSAADGPAFEHVAHFFAPSRARGQAGMGPAAISWLVMGAALPGVYQARSPVSVSRAW